MRKETDGQTVVLLGFYWYVDESNLNHLGNCSYDHLIERGGDEVLDPGNQVFSDFNIITLVIKRVSIDV